MKAVLIPILAAGMALSSAGVLAQDAATMEPAAGTSDRGAMGPMTKAQHHQKAQEMFKELDKDGNGSISQQEFTASHDAKFEKMDTNKDGTVSAEEHRAHMGKEKKPW